MYSLKRKLHRNLLLTVTLVMTILISIFYLGVQHLTRDYVISRLQHDVDSIVVALDKDADGLWVLSSERMSTVYSRVQSGHYYRAMVNNQRIRSRSLFDRDIDFHDRGEGEQCYVMDVTGQERWLACSLSVEKKGSVISIWIAEDISALEQAQQRFIFLAVGIALFAILILLLLQYHILQKGFSPFERLRETIKRMQLGTHELSLQTLPVEILPLMKEIDRLLIQLGQRVQRSRNALGNLAHELKRPLQRYRSQLETLNPKQRSEGDAILQEIHSVVDRELKRARIVGVSTPGRHTVIDEDLPHLIKVMQSIYPETLIESHCMSQLILPHDRDDILELLGNLLDNACKYSSKRVQVFIGRVEAGWRIRIEDDGKGVTQNALRVIANRGVRLDENVQGHGLGLAICKDIVDSYSGQMSFEKAKPGGLAVNIFMPDIE